MIESLLFSRRILVPYPCSLTLLSIIDEIMNLSISFSLKQKITHDEITRVILLQRTRQCQFFNWRRRQLSLLHKITSVSSIILGVKVQNPTENKKNIQNPTKNSKHNWTNWKSWKPCWNIAKKKPVFNIGFLEKSRNFSNEGNGLRPIRIFSKVLDCSQNTQ